MKSMGRRVAAALLAIAMLAAVPAFAQPYPAKPVRFIVSYAAGGGVDLMTRLLAQKLQEQTGQSFVVDNRAGASGTIGADAVARAAPDGYTLLSGGNPELTLMPHVLDKIGYDPLRDFAPVVLVANVPSVLVVHPSVPARSARELLEHARSLPGGLPYGTPGRGTPMHIAFEMLQSQSGIALTHVPYKGGGPAMQDVVAGQIGAAIINAPPVIPHIRSGKLRALAVMQSERSALLPNVPTFREATGIENVFATAWFAVSAPAKTPREIVARLETEILRALADPAMRSRLTDAGMDVVALPADRFAEQVRTESAYYGRAIKQFGIRPE